LLSPRNPEWLTKTARAFGLTDFYMDPYNKAQKNQISQVINSKKVSDHHAIIPTKTCADTDLSGLM